MIYPIHRIVQHIPVKIAVAPFEAYRVFRRPFAGIGVIFTEAEVCQLRVGVVEPAGETERHSKAWIGVVKYITETVVNDLFNDIAVCVGNGPEAYCLVVVKVESPARAVCHAYGHPAVCILEAPHKVVIFVIDRQQGREVFPEVSLYDGAVDLFGDAAVERVCDVVYFGTVRQRDIRQCAQGVDNGA